jgi:hypothetical protein
LPAAGHRVAHESPWRCPCCCGSRALLWSVRTAASTCADPSNCRTLLHGHRGDRGQGSGVRIAVPPTAQPAARRSGRGLKPETLTPGARDAPAAPPTARPAARRSGGPAPPPAARPPAAPRTAPPARAAAGSRRRAPLAPVQDMVWGRVLCGPPVGPPSLRVLPADDPLNMQIASPCLS